MLLDMLACGVKLVNSMAKEASSRLKFNLVEIPEEGTEISEDLPVEWLTNIPEFSEEGGTHIQGPIHIEGKLRRDGDNLRVWGEVSADLVTMCTRCGIDIHYPLQGSFAITMAPGPEPELGEEVELSPEEMIKVYYRGNEVDLNPVFREEVAIQVPIQPLCDPACKGLCMVCGSNLNEVECGCSREEGDPRLKALRNIKIEES